jgi:hypothetical protein
VAIDATRIAIAAGRGLSIVCATCERYHEARDRDIPGDTCLAVEGCGSPIAGDVFHEYKGPMTRFDKFCFVCGNEATHAVRVDNHVRVVGLCEPHVSFVKKLKPTNKRAASVVLISRDGEEVVDEDSLPDTSGILRLRG